MLGHSSSSRASSAQRRRDYGRLLRHLLLAVVLLGVLLGSAAIATACPMCKAGLAGEHDRLIQAWGVSIVFLLSMPFVLVTSFSAYMYLLVRRARREEAARRAAAATTETDFPRAETAHFVERERVGV